MTTAAPKAPAASMAQRGRARRVAKWAGLVVCVLIAGVWAASHRWLVRWMNNSRLATARQYHFLSLESGALLHGRFPDANPVLLLQRPDWAFASHSGETIWLPERSSRGTGVILIVPLWIPFAAFAVPTIVLWYCDRPSARRRRAGQCSKCGYDRGGLAVESPCPECGAAGSVAEA